jgi:two-component SAPR family response regulator
MYRVIAVDDEALAIRRFEHIVQKEDRLNLVATFTDSNKALEYVKNNKIDIAFLDIEMPSPNGLELSELLLEADPYISIVFVTAFDQYALEAFKAHAIGYLLKPLDLKDLKAQVDQIARTKQPREDLAEESAPSDSKQIVVHCIGQFSCYCAGNEKEPVSFRTAKTAELFALLIQHYNAPMSKYSILDAIFPDTDDEKSNKLFYVSCSYLRSAFTKYGITELLIRENDSYRLNTDIVECDYINIVKASDKMNSMSLEELEALAKQCNGEYLMGRAYEWAFETKTYVETISRRILLSLSDAYIDEGRDLEAAQQLEKYLIADPCNEEIVERLMTLYADLGQMNRVRAIYDTFKAKLFEQFKLKPSKNIRALLGPDSEE